MYKFRGYQCIVTSHYLLFLQQVINKKFNLNDTGNHFILPAHVVITLNFY